MMGFLVLNFFGEIYKRGITTNQLSNTLLMYPSSPLERYSITDAPRVGVSFFFICKEFNAELVILVSFALNIIQYVIIVISIVMYCFVV